ncbi:hypothetical protein QN085_20625 [Pseudomonas sp. M2(2023)]|uniref:hypothetical protein n=1 Tax=Pseudomonas TaxID=286 RepID=UPI002554293D|nr:MULTISPECIES: hypothetical protein [Pseudomonas]MDM9552978.1 hypothetical protein [Pseudomonas asiatica]WIV23055.1 hypothetical protein QN085_20625 [Pseudomonas sp. M2(2023)]
MNTTLPSTGTLPAVIRLLCPSAHADLADALFAELEAAREPPVKATGVEALRRELEALRTELARLKAQPAQQAERMRQSKIDAAEAKDEALQDAIAEVLRIKRRTLIDKKERHDRASFVQAQLESTPVGYGLPADYRDTARVKDIRLIRKALRAWEEKNGLSCKSKQQH